MVFTVAEVVASPEVAAGPARDGGAKSEGALEHRIPAPQGGPALGRPPACPSSLFPTLCHRQIPRPSGVIPESAASPRVARAGGGPDVRARRSGRGAGPAGQGRRQPSRPASPASFGTRLYLCAPPG